MPNVGIEVWPVHLPGHGVWKDEPLVNDIWQVVDLLAPAVSQQIEDLPYAFYGHSMGALVAFELACNLERRGERLPDALVLSACPPPPNLSQYYRSHTEGELLNKILKGGGFPSEITEDPDALEYFLPSLINDITLLKSYIWPTQRKPANVPFFLHGGLQDVIAPLVGLSAWREHTNSSVTLTAFPGGHFFFYHQAEAIQQQIAAGVRMTLSGK